MAEDLDAKKMLLKVKEAIIAVITRGQAVTVNGKTYTRANLAELRAIRSDLEAEVTRLDRGGMRIRQVVPRG